MNFLVFQLEGAMSSWGDIAVGEYRGTYDYPTQSALIGLLGAALGIRREEDERHMGLQQGYAFAIAVLSAGKLLRDYHTAQVPGRVALKGRTNATRYDELSVPKAELNTILSTRDYRQDAASLVAVLGLMAAPYTLERLAEGLRRPCFTLYLGRKSCPPAAPLDPLIMNADSVLEAFRMYRSSLTERCMALKDDPGRMPVELPGTIVQLAWDDRIEAGVRPDLTTQRKDRLIRRRGWQCGNRNEHIAVLTGASEHVL
ncbi:MAG: type I-E CRISPR-associated protein Cas5/CasD [Burkholderiales bacterium]|nr:type I-E CRISPR-associated protein Cas5/CasD [Burkholderiales bacterium]